MAHIVDGYKIADKIKVDLAQYFLSQDKKALLSVILVGQSKVSESYINIKRKTAEELGIEFELVTKDELASFLELARLISYLSQNSDATLVQLPVLGLKKDDLQQALDFIDKSKDIDVLSTKAYEIFQRASLELFGSILVPPVARALKHIFDEYKIDLRNKTLVILGKGKLVGKPVSDLVSKYDCKSILSFDYKDKDEDIKEALKKADIVVSGIGSPNFVKYDDVQKGAVLIDAGTSSQKNQIMGDISVDLEDKASLFAKVPGGVGPITIASLFENLRIITESQK